MAIDKRFLSSKVTRLRLKETSSYSKNLTFKDVSSRKVVFRTGPDWELKTLLDAEKRLIVNIATKENIKNTYYVYRPEGYITTTHLSEDVELLHIYVKQGAAMSSKRGYLDTTLRVDFTDITTGERCKIEIEGEWRIRSALLWLQRGPNGTRAAVGKIYRPPKALRDGFNLDVAPNVDTALVLLICSVVDDDLKRLRIEENKREQPGPFASFGADV